MDTIIIVLVLLYFIFPPFWKALKALMRESVQKGTYEPKDYHNRQAAVQAEKVWQKGESAQKVDSSEISRLERVKPAKIGDVLYGVDELTVDHSSHIHAKRPEKHRRKRLFNGLNTRKYYLFKELMDPPVSLRRHEADKP